MKVIFIWENKTDVKSKTSDFHRKMKPVKLNGKKPNKIILHATDDKPENYKVIKKLVSYDGLIITTAGNPIYDRSNGIL